MIGIEYLKPAFYAKATGILLATAGIVGFFLPSDFLGLLTLETNHNFLHLAFASVALYAYASDRDRSIAYAKAFGVTYLVLGISGTISPLALGAAGIRFDMAENVTHLVLGLWGMSIGFMK